MDVLPAHHRFAHRTSRFKPSTIREMLKVTQNPHVISFGGGLPAAEFFPVDEIAAAQDQVIRTRAADALQYSVTEGIPELRGWIAARLSAKTGVALDADDIVMTSGSQQGLDLYGRVLLDPGDAIAVQNPSYLGAIQAFDAFEPSYLTVDSDADGVIPDALERTLAAANPLPKFLYLVPNYENPTGAMLSAERRPQVVAICERYGVPILEDDPYSDLWFEQPSPPQLLASARRGTLTYLGTGSKMVAPGLRIAWMAVPDRALRDHLVTAKQGADLHSSTYAQYVFAAYVEEESRLERHLARVRAAYRARRDAMIAALEREMPKNVRWNVPHGGMFLWVTVDGVDTEDLFPVALRDDVVFVPGRPFYPHKDRGDGMRLNFSAMPEERIAEGIRRLAHAVRRQGG